MPTLHLTNIGGQVLPVLQGIMEFPCDKAILLHSKESLVEALKVQKIITVLSELVLLEEPNNFKSITEVLQKLQKNHSNATWDVNISSGTKIMSVALYSAFLSFKAPSRLFHIEQNGLVHHLLPELKSEKLNTFLPVSTYFECAGHTIKKTSYFKNLNADILKAYEKSKLLFGEKKFKNDIFQLLSLYRKNYPKKDIHNSFSIGPLKNGSKLVWDNQTECLMFFKNEHKCYEIQSAHAISMLLETKWFELEVASVLSKWKQNKEMLWEVVVATADGKDKNEIDLIVNTGTKLLFVECKTQVHDVKDVDKFQNVTAHYGGFGAKALLITYSPLKKSVEERCAFNKILHFSFFNKNNQSNNIHTLLSMLDEEILKTNK